MTTSRIWGNAPAERTITKFGVRGRVVDVIICVKFYRNRLRGFRVVGAENGGLPLTLTVALTTGQHYRAACDKKSFKKCFSLCRTLWLAATTFSDEYFAKCSISLKKSFAGVVNWSKRFFSAGVRRFLSHGLSCRYSDTWLWSVVISQMLIVLFDVTPFLRSKCDF